MLPCHNIITCCLLSSHAHHTRPSHTPTTSQQEFTCGDISISNLVHPTLTRVTIQADLFSPGMCLLFLMLRFVVIFCYFWGREHFKGREMARGGGCCWACCVSLLPRTNTTNAAAATTTPAILHRQRHKHVNLSSQGVTLVDTLVCAAVFTDSHLVVFSSTAAAPAAADAADAALFTTTPLSTTQSTQTQVCSWRSPRSFMARA